MSQPTLQYRIRIWRDAGVWRFDSQVFMEEWIIGRAVSYRRALDIAFHAKGAKP